jgi:methylmalonyl-CoA mutase N-terminal domain/subunit
VETCTYDEPICIPTHEARELAIRTQQILAHEVGAARTADPLGGSWYVESLTDEVESAALALLAEIEGVGLANAVESGWLESLMDNVNYNAEQEIARGERIVVGVNAFTRPAEEVPTRFTFDTAPIAEHVAAFSQWKSRREHINLDAAIRELHDAAIRGENCIGAMIRAFMMDATIGEVWGTFREAMGYHYDPFGVVQSPFTKLTDH